ncbi:hypothetical protein H4R35_001203, partial [Dimargaris xerosporica]
MLPAPHYGNAHYIPAPLVTLVAQAWNSLRPSFLPDITAGASGFWSDYCLLERIDSKMLV